MKPDEARRLAEQLTRASRLYRDALKLPRIVPPEIARRPIEVGKNYQLADTLYEHIQEFIRKAEAELGAKQRLVVLFFDRVGRPIVVSDIGYHNPTMMIVWGMDPEGNDCSILVHMSSFELVLQVVEEQQETPRRPIGFVAPEPTSQ